VSTTWKLSASRPSGMPSAEALAVAHERIISSRLSVPASWLWWLRRAASLRSMVAVMSTPRVDRGEAMSQTIDDMGLEAGGEKFGMRVRVSGVRVNGLKRCFARGEMIRVARADAVPVALRRLADHSVGPDDPDHSGDVAAKLERDYERAVRIAEEVHVGDSYLGRGLPLFLLADLPESGSLHARDRAAGRPVGHDAVRHRDPLVGPSRDRACCAEINVVRVGRDDEHSCRIA